MLDGRSVIHFCANSIVSEDVLHCLYEIGCRIKRPFIIHRAMATVPSDGFVIMIGDYPSDWVKDRPSINLGKPCHELTDSDWIENLDRLERQHNLLQLALMLLGFHQEHAAPLDSMGRISPGGNRLVVGDKILHPWLELIAAEVWARALKAGCPDIEPHQPWRRDRIHLCMTHDVDGPELFSLFATMRSGYLGLIRNDKYERESFLMSLLMRREGAPDPYFNFDLWREYESILGGRSTFFVYPGRISSGKWHRKDPKYSPEGKNINTALRRAVDSGWEVGTHFGICSHGVNSYAQARKHLNSTVYTTVIGGRSHYWKMNWKNPYETWRNMWAAGYSYDMTLSPMTLGFRGGFMLPISPAYRWQSESSLEFCAVPTAIMDAYTVPRNVHCSQSDMDHKLDLLLDFAQDQGAPLVLDWHVRTFINRGTWAGYLGSLVYLLTEAQKRGGVSLISGEQMVSQWREHVGLTYKGTL